MINDRTLLVVVTCVTFSLAATPTYAERKIMGYVKDLETEQPLSGYRVRAVDVDANADDLMGEDITDANGWYTIQYRAGSWDGPHSRHHTQWRPDIVLKVAKPKPGGGWEPVDQSGERTNWKVRNDIRHDFKVPASGQCPYPAKFDTTGSWQGCQCRAGTHKRWLDAFKKEARCADGVQSEQKQCEMRNGTWFGINDSWGNCVVVPAPLAPHKYLLREAYYHYMEKVSEDVTLETLPDWVEDRYSKYFKNVDLDEVRFGESEYQNEKGAIADCKRIYFPPDVLEGFRVEDPEKTNYYWLLHELAHTDQCMGMPNPLVPGDSKRDLYADMWFGNLPEATLISILEDGKPVDDSIHDKMPMEKNADELAAHIITETGIGTVPQKACPSGKFGTRDKRGCVCALGAVKRYSGLFDESAECVARK